MNREETLRLRRQVTGHNLALGYEEPLKIVRGEMQYLFDDSGRRYLDAYNNVPHVGHCHPEVVEAAAEQMRTLNTNTRYLSERFNEYAEALLDTLPTELDTCFLVNSASEANELALRLARAVTGRKDTLVTESAYHGHTTTLIDISPYKHNGPGGEGAPDWVHTVPVPDPYRGVHRGPASGRLYANTVRETIARLEESGKKPCAFIAETYPSVGGQIITPNGYLREAYQHVRKAGGICIADEVQTSYGRIGKAFYAFEEQEALPDAVVMGKPIGNGHPLAAVVTRRDIADAFDNGMEFFSTFGGSTLSCAIGMKVLEITHRDRLQEHAESSGTTLLKELHRLKLRHPLIGDVRGSGLFIGVELVEDAETLMPSPDKASQIVNQLKDAGILIGTDGPHHNILKIRPPLPFDQDNAVQLASALDHILERIDS